MLVKVEKHKCIIEKTPVNEKEVNITKVQFEFDEDMQDMVKEAYFTYKNNSYKVIIQNNECNIPNEVLTEKGQVELGVVCFEVQNEELIQRFNPSPAYFDSWSGSLKQATNTEPITPTDKEQIEQQLNNISTQMDNLDIEAEKVEHTTTITITRKDGTSYEVEVLDGEKGEKGEQGIPGAIKMLIVNELPSTGEGDTIYLLPITGETGNNYEEYIYVNNAWEKLGGIQVEVDLTDYVKNTDYATNNVGGVIKTNSNYGTTMINGYLGGDERSFAGYNQMTNYGLIGKGTLENVITGKGLVSNTDYASTTNAGVIKVGGTGETFLGGSNQIACLSKTYAQYQDMNQYGFISKGTLENVLTATIGNISSVIDTINNEVI